MKNIYRFFGFGYVWNPFKSKIMCSFNNGIYETDKEEEIKILKNNYKYEILAIETEEDKKIEKKEDKEEEKIMNLQELIKLHEAGTKLKRCDILTVLKQENIEYDRTMKNPVLLDLILSKQEDERTFIIKKLESLGVEVNKTLETQDLKELLQEIQEA